MEILPKSRAISQKIGLNKLNSQKIAQGKNGILIAFGELFLKSEGVKKIFKRKLTQNLSFFIRKEGLPRTTFRKNSLDKRTTQKVVRGLDFKIYSFRDRIFVALSSKAPNVSKGRIRETKQLQKASKIIKRVFGIVWFADCLFFPEAKLKDISAFLSENYQKRIKITDTFAIRLKKEKNFLKESREEIIDEIAKNIKRKVDLSHPKKEIFIEVRKNGWFLYFKKQKAQGGLPVGTAGKVLSLISGGIDSPVAVYLITKRGAENIWLHFHSFPLVSKASIEKVKELAKIFLDYQPRLRIYFVPFQKAQIEIKTKIPAKYRILLYRRLMFMIAERIAKKENCYSLVTGESLGQVSSQTLPNIEIIEEAVKIPILRPLIGMDKVEIINLAKKIKTFSISIKPQEDCCTLFVPKHQTAKGNLEIIRKLEKKLEIKKIIKEAIKATET